jgi:hypothetical protein
MVLKAEDRGVGYGDNEFRGAGLLRCRVCNEPYTEHKRIGPCEALGVGSGTIIADKRAPYPPPGTSDGRVKDV